jgi:hypothetical protein
MTEEVIPPDGSGKRQYHLPRVLSKEECERMFANTELVEILSEKL